MSLRDNCTRALQYLEARCNCITDNKIEEIKAIKKAFILLFQLIEENKRLEFQLKEWQRVAKQKQETIDELRVGFENVHKL